MKKNKLRLDKSTLRNLKDHSLEQVVGGTIDPSVVSCSYEPGCPATTQ